jgi:predicted nucleic acid-binding protein
MNRAVADTSVFIAWESGRKLGDVPEELAVSVITAAELELGVLRAKDAGTRARRLATLAQMRAQFPLLSIDDATGSSYARIADEELSAGRKLRRHDVWIAATALRHDAAVVTQDADFTSFRSVEVVYV